MLRFLIILFTYFILNGFSICLTFEFSGPRYPSTKGEVWPKPQYQEKHDRVYKFYPDDFHVRIVGQNCSLLCDTIRRYGFKRRDQQPTFPLHEENQQQSMLEELVVDLAGPCEEYPHLDMDESYKLTVGTSSKLLSNSIWGIIRGFETFSQLAYRSEDNNDLVMNQTRIDDYPRYSHRGLLLDTSRHFIKLHTILLTLEAMAMNKMNVFHWHIVDDESFPYQSEKFPELSERGAYHPSMVYTKADIALVVNYARERGIRVVPEFDVPGHTRSWGESHPEILTKCYVNDVPAELGPMHPIANATYQLLHDLIQEGQSWFPDRYYHIGGDEVAVDCWASNPELKAYMEKHNMTDANEFHALFMKRVIPLLGNKSEPIVWQEVFDNHVPLSPGTLVHVWKNDFEYKINEILNANHKVLFSAEWYLSSLHNGGDWHSFYVADPRKLVEKPSLELNVLGGEACMWGEVVDDTNVISRVWPRACAVAEVLWSAPLSGFFQELKWQLEDAETRLEEHTCRMNRRGIPAQPPNGPGFCLPYGNHAV